MNLRQLVSDLAGGEAVQRFVQIGALSPRFLAGGAATLPWLLGRGASLGTLCQIHGVGRASQLAIVDRRGELTWRELDRRVNRLGHALRERGVEPGDQVAILLRNGREFVESVLACQKQGLVAAPLNTWGKARELGGILDREAPAALVHDVRHGDQLDGQVPNGMLTIHVGDEEEPLAGSVAYEEMLAGGSPRPSNPFVSERGTTRVLIHTSGTTGTPKAASRDTGGEGGAALLGVLDTVPYRHDDVMYIPNPMFHSLGVLTLSIGMITGATMVLPDGFDPEQAWRDLERYRVTAASFVPVMLRRMLNLDDAPNVDLDRLRIVLVSGAAMPPELRRRTTERMGEVLYDLYGSTEAGWIAIATPDSLRAAPEAVGAPVAGVELAILDTEGRPVSDGEGEIHVRSPGTFEGYASGEETTVRDGYLSTGDLGYLDDQGYLHVVGRADDMVVVGGENVFPDEIEAVIGELDGVDECAVLGAEDEELGQVLVAFVVGSVDAQRVEEVCRDQLASYKVPRRVHVVDELPRTSTGKVLRNELKDRDQQLR